MRRQRVREEATKVGEGTVNQVQDPKYEKNGFLRGYKTAVRGE
jgi:hypothetical protein